MPHANGFTEDADFGALAGSDVLVHHATPEREEETPAAWCFRVPVVGDTLILLPFDDGAEITGVTWTGDPSMCAEIVW